MEKLCVNGKVHQVDADKDMPLLLVLRDLLARYAVPNLAAARGFVEPVQCIFRAGRS